MIPAADGQLADPTSFLLLSAASVQPTFSEHRRWRRAWLVSFSVHLLGLLLAASPAWWKWSNLPDADSGRQISLDSRQIESAPDLPQHEAADLLLAADDTGRQRAQQLLEELSLDDWPEWRAMVEAEAANTNSAASTPPPIDPLAAFGQKLEALLVSGATSGSHLPPEERLARLKQLAGELEEISSPAAVEEVATSVQRLLGTTDRADRPASGLVAGEFDFDTAQLHEVRRVRGPDGQFEYLSVLVDAAGRKFETPLDPVEGESAYRTMELLKSSPLAELVYRRVAMGLLDKLINAGRHATRPIEPKPAATSEPAVPVDP